jgi:hypothetical protein
VRVAEHHRRYGLRAAIEFVNRVGVPRIGEAVRSLADRVYCELAQRGFEMCGVRTPENGAGIVSLRKPGEEAGYGAAIDGAWLSGGAAPRVGAEVPHFYIAPGDIENMIGALL